MNWTKVLLTFLIATFLFFFGFFIGYLTQALLKSSTISIQDTAKTEILNLETLSMLESQYPCESYVVDTLTDRLDYVGGLISTLEERQGKTNTDVLELKKLYSILEVRHMLLVNDKNKQCNANYSIFLYFYSNDPTCKTPTDETAFVFTYLRRKFDTVRVYSFDKQLNSDLVKALLSHYQIDNSCSSVVFDGKTYNGYPARTSFYESLIVNQSRS